MKLALTTFVITQLLAALIAWLGGYDFNSRSIWVAFFTTTSITIGALASFVVYEILGDHRD